MKTFSVLILVKSMVMPVADVQSYRTLVSVLKRKYKALLITLMTIIAANSVMAQNWEAIKADKEYIWGEGHGNTEAEADHNALNDLISRIAVNISTSSSQELSQTMTNGTSNTKAHFKSTMQTYSQATLTNTEKIVLMNEPNAKVGRWIRKSEISKIFASRKDKINDFIEYAIRAEGDGKIDDALRYYYWALALTKSLQYPNEMKYDEHILMTWIPEMMNHIFDDLKVDVIKHEGEYVELYITYKNKPVNSIDYTYYDGQGWSNKPTSANGGKGVIELVPGYNPKKYDIRYEYKFKGQTKVDDEINSVMDIMADVPMPNADVKISSKIDHTQSEEIAKQEANRQEFKTFSKHESINAIETIHNPDDYNVILSKFVDAIKTKKYNTIETLFTPDGLNIYNELIKYGNAKVIGTPVFRFYNYEDGVVVRGLQMAFSFKTSARKAFVEDVVLTFDEGKKICNITFGLGKTAENDILYRKAGKWDEHSRKTIMNFLENYKTAYALKRLDYIKSIFDDNAIIIIGNVAKKSSPKTINAGKESVSATFSQKGQDIIKYNRYTKDEYLRNLERCFNSNEFINIRFSNNEVGKMDKGGELYGIQIQQDYYSSTYCDQGYLFLEVDINNPQQPTIILRTWQPEKDPKFGLYGSGDF